MRVDRRRGWRWQCFGPPRATKMHGKLYKIFADLTCDEIYQFQERFAALTCEHRTFQFFEIKRSHFYEVLQTERRFLFSLQENEPA